jgi:hypothetical protein
MTIKERLELDAAIERKLAEFRILYASCGERYFREAWPSWQANEIWQWKQRNPGVTMIDKRSNASEGSTSPDDYFYPGQGRAQQSLFRQVIQFDIPDNEQLKKAA